MKRVKKLLGMLIIMITFILTPGFIAEAYDNEGEYENAYAKYVGEFNVGNGITCEVYEIPTIQLDAGGTKSKTYDFTLSYGGTYFGYLRQTTKWSYDGVNRPTLLSKSSTFYSTDPSKHYLLGRGDSTEDNGNYGRQYTRKADVYYNNNRIATTNFTTICDRSGNFYNTCTDD